MYINNISAYIPEEVVTNEYFADINGLSDDWIIERTGIRERRKAGPGENSSSMGIAAVRAGMEGLSYETQEINLIVGATYTPHDTIATLGHAVQHSLNIHDIPVVTISSACSSLVNALEIVEGYFAMGKADKALVVASEHNTGYNNEEDKKAGHLWGDGAVAVFVSKERLSKNDMQVKDILTGGAATRGKAMEGVTLKPLEKGIIMPNGRDVFINACIYMPKAVNDLLERNKLTIDQVDYVVPHQANLRITKNVAGTLNIPEEKALSNVQYLGNTGCAGCGIAIAEHQKEFKKGQKLIVTVFGGGYSYGAMLIEV